MEIEMEMKRLIDERRESKTEWRIWCGDYPYSILNAIFGFDTKRRTTSEDAVRAVVDEAVDSLPRREKEAMMALFCDKLSVDEVCAKMGISELALMGLEGSALRRLRHPSCSRVIRRIFTIGNPEETEKEPSDV